MVATNDDDAVRSFRIVKEIRIKASPEIAFEALLAEIGAESQMPDGAAFPMAIEAWPGGRWFRDLGKNAGHLWGHIQVIKPPLLLELSGPMFMSYACSNHLQYRLTSEDSGTRLVLTHTAIGLINDQHRAGVSTGWEYRLKRVAELAHQRK